MAAQLIEESDVVTVTALATVIFGPPGTGKTSLAQTADQPFTLDFDRGVHRSFNRKRAMRFDAWGDVLAADPHIRACKTVVVDTIGRLLDVLSADIIAESAKNMQRGGGLSLQGFGILKARFAAWMNQLRLAGKDVVLVCHEKEEKDGDNRIMRPDIQGGSYTEVHKLTDLIGYLGMDHSGGRRTLDFNPSDRHIGKNACGWEPLAVPKLEENPTFLADLLADAKARIGKTAEASAAIARAVDEWDARLTGTQTLADLNDLLTSPELKAVPKSAKSQVWAVFEQFADAKGWAFDKTAKHFVEAAA